MKNALIASFFAAATLVPVTASAAVLGFENGTASATPITSYSEDGYTFGITFSGANSTGAALFDTTCRDNNTDCGGDEDLTPGWITADTQGTLGVGGNVLIRQEAGATVPDDAATSGTITFTLQVGKAFRLIGFSAIDDGTFSMSTVADGTLVAPLGLNENQIGQRIFSTPSSIIRVGDSFTFNYSGSGAFDSVILSAVPVPAALPLMLVALGGLGVTSRRRRTPFA
jgi:hypothetical protein